MLKKLNDSLHQVRLRLLSLDQLQQRVAKILEAGETDDDDLYPLSTEVQRRLAATPNATERAALQVLANRLVRHKLTRDIEPGVLIEPDLMTKPRFSMSSTEAMEILALVLALSDNNAYKLEQIEGKRITRAFQILDEAEISQAVAALIEVLKSKTLQPQTIVFAASVLGHIGPAAKLSVPALVQVIESSEYGKSWAAAWALGQMGEAAVEAIPALIRMLPGKDVPRSTKCAALALGMMGSKAAIAIPALEQASADRNVGHIVKLALACVKGEQPISVLVREMAEEDPLGSRVEKIRLKTSEIGPIGKCMCSVPD